MRLDAGLNLRWPEFRTWIEAECGIPLAGATLWPQVLKITPLNQSLSGMAWLARGVQWKAHLLQRGEARICATCARSAAKTTAPAARLVQNRKTKRLALNRVFSQFEAEGV